MSFARWAWCCVVLFGGLVQFAAAQTSRDDPTDWRGQASTTLKLDLPRRWEAAWQYQARLVNGISDFRGSYLSLDLSRGVGRKVTLLGGYRLALLQDGTYHRVQLGVEASRTLRSVTAGVRVLAQHQQQNFDDGEDDRDNYLRIRVEARHDLTKSLSLYGSIEPALQFEGGYLVDSWRDRLGMKFRFAKHARIDGYYIYRPDFAKSYRRTFHTIGLDAEWAVRIGR